MSQRSMVTVDVAKVVGKDVSKAKEMMAIPGLSLVTAMRKMIMVCRTDLVVASGAVGARIVGNAKSCLWRSKSGFMRLE